MNFAASCGSLFSLAEQRLFSQRFWSKVILGLELQNLKCRVLPRNSVTFCVQNGEIVLLDFMRSCSFAG